MESPFFVPLLVAFIGAVQFLLSYLGGRSNRRALANKDDATAVREIAASYQLLVESLETRLGYMKEAHSRLEKESLSQAKVIIDQQALIRELDSLKTRKAKQ